MTRRSALALALVLVLGCRGDEIPDFWGLRLGMTATDVRDRFTAKNGSFKAETAADDYTIRWTPKEPADDSPREVELAFHMGSLVAITAKIPEASAFAKGPPFVITKRSALKRSPSTAGLVDVELLARDCPTHRSRSEAIVDEASRR